MNNSQAGSGGRTRPSNLIPGDEVWHEDNWYRLDHYITATTDPGSANFVILHLWAATTFNGRDGRGTRPAGIPTHLVMEASSSIKFWRPVKREVSA